MSRLGPVKINPILSLRHSLLAMPHRHPLNIEVSDMQVKPSAVPQSRHGAKQEAL